MQRIEYDTAVTVNKKTNSEGVNFTLKEPEIEINKSYTAGIYDGGDTVNYKLEIWHSDRSSPMI
ncbi:MAG: hypothetical protein U5K53_08585 [Halanaerobiales bacterium]|nr:hypothetical protein [Halanaerobiales bacterium]